MEKEEKINIMLTFNEIIELHRIVQEKIKNKNYGYIPAMSVLLCGEDNLTVKTCSVNEIAKEVMKSDEENRKPNLLNLYKDITDREKFEFI